MCTCITTNNENNSIIGNANSNANTNVNVDNDNTLMVA